MTSEKSDYNNVLNDMDHYIRTCVKRFYDLQPVFDELKNSLENKDLRSTQEWKMNKNVIDKFWELQNSVHQLRDCLDINDIRVRMKNI